jgi:uncharacterized protein
VTTQREIAERLGLPVHPPKIEIFDLEGHTNTDPKQHVRDVDEYRLEPFGLYMARPMPGHPRMTYVESWLLPDLGMRISDWHFRPEYRQDQDFYLDIVDIERGPARWRSIDHYLDIVVGNRRYAQLLDIDEFVVAIQANLVDTATAHRAMATAYEAVDGLARHGYDLPAWLREKGVELSWRRQPS